MTCDNILYLTEIEKCYIMNAVGARFKRIIVVIVVVARFKRIIVVL